MSSRISSAKVQEIKEELERKYGTSRKNVLLKEKEDIKKHTDNPSSRWFG